MNVSRVFIRSVVLISVLLPATIGAIAVNVSPNCQRYVSAYVTAPVRRHIGKATVLAWAKWRIAHPNWKPKPGAQGSKALLARKKGADEANFPCEVSPIPAITNSLLAMVGNEKPPALVDFSAMNTEPSNLPDLTPEGASKVLSGEAASNPPGGSETSGSSPIRQVFDPAPPVVGGTPLVPVVPPDVLPVNAVVPEPPSLLLAASGIVACGLFWRRRQVVVA